MAANKVGTVLATVGELTDVDTTARNPLGSVAFDEAGGQYIYLEGVISTVANDAVSFDENFATTRLASHAVGQVAVANAAVVASKYGWYCIVSPLNGFTVHCDATVTGDKAAYIGGTAGGVDDDGAAGDLICNMFVRSGDTAGHLTAQFDHPCVTDQLGA
jgi:hypothetical protein